MTVEFRKFSGCIRGKKVNEAGVATGPIFDFGDIANLGLDIKKELVKAISNKCDSAGLTIASRAKNTTVSGSMVCNEWQSDVAVEALGATVSAETIESSILTDEDIALAGYGYWAEIGTKRLSDVTVTLADSTELVKGTDYLIDEYMGLVKPIKGSAHLPTGIEHVLITAVGDEDTDPVYTLGAGTSGTYAIMGHLFDAWSQKNGELYLDKVRLVLSTPVSFVAGRDDDHSALEFEVSPEVLEGKTSFGTFSGEVLG